MCGIVGYIGEKEAAPLLIEGLKRLEYRGYDSAGLAFVRERTLIVTRSVGRISELEAGLSNLPSGLTIGIGHTRWATHGKPSVSNAHPHSDCRNEIAVVHNGVIENYGGLKKMLTDRGHRFKSETDTEVIAHLVEEYLREKEGIEEAIRHALLEVRGAYGLVVMSTMSPETLYVARRGSPLIVGVGSGEMLVASDPAALVKHTRKVLYVGEGEMAVVTREGVSTKTLDAVRTTPKVEELTMNLEQIEKGGFEHFMLKEIFEQPDTIADAMRGRVDTEEGTVRLGGLQDMIRPLQETRRIIVIGCGTSWHAALIGEYMIEQYAGIPVEVEYASEFRYRNPVLFPGDVVFAISQSGETADTLAAVREAKSRGAMVYGICNVVGSTIARESDAGVYIHAGPEIGVASTKAFTSQLTVLSLLTLFLARLRGAANFPVGDILRGLTLLPEKAREVLRSTDRIRQIAEHYRNKRNFLYLGRGYNFPVALEGALKLKEISYIHAEGYPAAEMKHGPIALIDQNMPVVVLAPRDGTYDKVISNIEEVKARGGEVIALINEGDDHIPGVADHSIFLPSTHDLLMPILSVIPLQLLAYHIALMRGCNVDQPRNLAKSVTVE